MKIKGSQTFTLNDLPAGPCDSGLYEQKEAAYPFSCFKAGGLT